MGTDSNPDAFFDLECRMAHKATPHLNQNPATKPLLEVAWDAGAPHLLRWWMPETQV
jgi:hypothetical protein